VERLEDIHESLFDTHVLIQLAHDLEPDALSPDRIPVLLRVANRSAREAYDKMKKLIEQIYRRQREAVHKESNASEEGSDRRNR
jgi:hypothetical protein